METELEQERDRRTAVDARGLAVVSSASGLVTLVFALAVVVTGKDYRVSGAAAGAVVASLLCFVGAAVAGILASVNRSYRVADPPTLRLMLTDHWTDSETNAKNGCAMLNVRTLETLRAGNNKKVALLAIALSLQVAAVTGLIIAMTIEVARAVR